MTIALEREAEIIPGYRLLEPLGRGGVGEVWKCEAPGGFFKALKIVHGGNQVDGEVSGFEQELRALNQIKLIRHPFLLSMDRVELVAGDLVIVMELADKCLRALLNEYQEAGEPGLPRPELIGYLLEAAEALDLMNLQHQLLHLDIKPDNIFLVCHHVKIADFGLVNRSDASGQTELVGLTPMYAAPERFQGYVARSTDQYSLALVYLELLTGRLPFDGKDARQLQLQHTSQPPDLTALPESDRPVLAKALAKNPSQRFASCLELVHALLGETVPSPLQPAGSGPRRSQVMRSPPNGATRNLRLPGSDPTEAKSQADDGWGESPAQVDPIHPPPKSPSGSRELLQGYTFQERLGQGPCGEYWRTRATDGSRKLVQMVYGYPARTQLEEAQILQRLKAMRHSGLARLEVVQESAGRFFLISEMPEQTLWDRFQQCRAEGLAGIPRDELFDHLLIVAETLDDLFEDYQILHLGLSTGCLQICKNRVRITDFGLIHLFWGEGVDPLGPLNARYAAPELFREPPHRSCDAYSLALLFQELHTGIHPLRGQAARPTTTARKTPKLDFGSLPEPMRHLMAQALDPDPAKRFPSCMALIEALKGKPNSFGSRTATATLSVPEPVRPVLLAVAAAVQLPPLPPIRPVLKDLVAAAAGAMQVHEQGSMRYLLYPGERMIHKCAAALHADVAKLKMEGFRQEWKAKALGGDGQCHFALLVNAPTSFWQRCLGREPGLQIEVRLQRGTFGVGLSEIFIQLQPAHCDKDTAIQLLEESGPVLLASLRTYLQPIPERRAEPRIVYEHQLELRPVLSNKTLGEPLVALSKDVSMGGMRLWLPETLSVAQVCIQLPQPNKAGVVPALANVRNIQPMDDGGCELGVRFVSES